MNFYVAANWKMNKTMTETQEFLSEFTESFERKAQREAVFFPSYLSLIEFTKMSKELFSFGGQNCSTEMNGAYTGEVSIEMLQSLGSTYCLVGHSERRQMFGETDESVYTKTKLIASQGVRPMVCIGETEQEREQGKTLERLSTQLKTLLAEPIPDLLVAYEPVWAIGTGKVPSVEDINNVHNFIRQQFVESWGAEGEKVPLLYGGSVKPSNCKEIESVEHVNGFLIGGASLKADSLLQIYSGV